MKVSIQRKKTVEISPNLVIKKKLCKRKNKAGYTAISCGRVGRSGNARFPTFQLERDNSSVTDGQTDGRTDGQSLL